MKTVQGNLAYRRKLLKKAEKNEGFQESLWMMCKRDQLFFVNFFVYTFDPRLVERSNVVPFVTYQFQDIVFDDIDNALNIGQDQGSEKSRDMGASWMYLISFLHRWLFFSYQTFRLISENENKVDMTDEPDCLFWKLEFALKHLPPFLRPSFKKNHLLLKNFDTESTITGCATTGDATRGGRCTGMLIDEMAAISEANALMSSTQAVTNCRLYNSTHQGAATAFYRLMNNEKTPKMVLHWSLHPVKQRGLYYSKNGKLIVLDKKYKGMVRPYGQKEQISFPDDYEFRLDGRLRSPWYDYECDRASHPMEIAQELDMDPFASDFQYFDADVISRIEKEDCRPPYVEGILEFDEDSLEPIGFVEAEGGHMRLWFHPDAYGHAPVDLKVVSGHDISAGTGASNTTGSYVNLKTGEKIAEYANPWHKPESYAKLAIATAKWLNEAYLIWDGAGPGRTFSEEIIRLGYRNIYYKRNEKSLSKKVSDHPGVFLNPDEKKAVIGAYSRALKDRTFIQRSSIANTETLSFIYTVRNTIEHSASANAVDPSGAKNNHGDLVIADALASKALDLIGGDKLKSDDELIPQNCHAARKQERERRAKKKSEW